jgi:hypothetical protein
MSAEFQLKAGITVRAWIRLQVLSGIHPAYKTFINTE